MFLTGAAAVGIRDLDLREGVHRALDGIRLDTGDLVQTTHESLGAVLVRIHGGVVLVPVFFVRSFTFFGRADHHVGENLTSQVGAEVDG